MINKILLQDLIKRKEILETNYLTEGEIGRYKKIIDEYSGKENISDKEIKYLDMIYERTLSKNLEFSLHDHLKKDLVKSIYKLYEDNGLINKTKSTFVIYIHSIQKKNDGVVI
ncbi:MAG: hypothetical protein KKB62_02455 [Nanoarchaeota archaeon]|nr:hypothetical protein [Nanoarchaeota archaeon]